MRVRVPADQPADRVVLRTTPDAEPRFAEARPDRTDRLGTWWVAELEVTAPLTTYRFAIERDRAAGLGVDWLNAAGVHRHDVADAADFQISTHRPPPAWLSDTVGYQIFPDRFARSDAAARRTAPDWSRPAAWDDPVAADGPTAVRQVFGGDLRGVEDHLDHLTSLGANLVYLTPFFPGHSSHRYDATTFAHVDPLLGGDEALASLCRAAHARGVRIIGDLTLNHTGRHHEWFERAQADAASPEAGSYLFRHHPDDYVAWYDLPHLPKLDHRDAELRRRLFDGPDSVVARWLRPPFELDGWRIDCANTTARLGEVDLNQTVARATRATMTQHHRDPWLVAEHCYDASEDLAGDGWHGTMAYQWFTRPLAQWLGTMSPLRTMSSRPLPRLDGATMVRAMRELATGVPWTARAASMTMLDSHDTPRFRSLVNGDRTAHLTALAALLTMPGVPTIFAGSEVGVIGDSMNSARVPFPWDPSAWDHQTLDATSALIGVRRTSRALTDGGFRWVHATPEQVAYVRETVDERILVQLRRDDSTPLDAPDGSEMLADTGRARIWQIPDR